MKKLTALMAAALMLCGCSNVSSTVETPDAGDMSGMYIEQAQLNEDEENIIRLLGMEDSGLICDFAADEDIKSVHITIYKYNENEKDWEEYTRDSRLFSDAEGRIALTYDDMENGVKTSFQSESDKGSTEFYPDTSEKYDTGCIKVKLSTRVDMQYNEEIPVAIQVYTGDEGPSSVGLESFFEPGTLEGCEGAYVVTLEFSDMKLDEYRDYKGLEEQEQRTL